MKKIVSLCLTLAVLLSSLCITAFSADGFEKNLLQFPSYYRDSLRELHAKYPKWTFKPLNTGLTFKQAVNAEHNCSQRLCVVQGVSASSPKACPASCKYASKHYDPSENTRCASVDYIAQCMDPTNYLDAQGMFQFEDSRASTTYTKDKIDKILKAKSSFMYNTTCKVGGKTYYYSQIILDSCKANGIDAMSIISRITKEVGSANPSQIAKGTTYNGKTVYNFFNIGGTYEMCKKYAYQKNWTNPKAALEGGISFIAVNYVKSGQFTPYLQKFQVNPGASDGLYQHQYMQGVDAVVDEAKYTYNSYYDSGLLSSEHTFSIPVYNNLFDFAYESGDVRFKDLPYSNKYAYVNNEISGSVNFRTGPSTSYSRIGSVAAHTTLQVSSVSGNWCKVKVCDGKYKNKEGYIYGDYVSYCQVADVCLGKTAKINPVVTKSKYTFSESSSFFSVSGNTIKGEKVGKGWLKVTLSSGAVSFAVVNCIQAPAKPKVSANLGTNSITLSWNSVSAADFYRVFRYYPDTKTYKHLGTTSDVTYKVGSLSSGTDYYLLVRAVNSSGVSSDYTSADNLKVRTLCARPSFTLSANSNSVTLKWSKVTGATYYRIWSYNKSTKAYTALGNTTALSYKVTGLKSNTEYTYLVRAYNGAALSAFTVADTKSITTAPSKPSVSANLGTNSITLSWNKVPSASFYRVFRYYPNTKSYKHIGSVNGTSFKVGSLSSGMDYYLLVRAVNSSGVSSDYTSADNLKARTLCARPSFTLSANSNSVTLKWSKVTGATYYRIWSYNKSTKAYTALGNTTALSYKVTGLKSNTEYTYLVRAYNGAALSAFTVADTKSIKTK